MDVRRNGGLNPLLQHTALWLVVIAATSITACSRAHADADEPDDVTPARVRVESSDEDNSQPAVAVERESRRQRWASPQRGGETFVPASFERRRDYPVRRGPSGLFMTLLSALSVLLFVFVWRRPCGTAGNSHAVAPPSPRDIVCLSCSRCGRVIDVRRDNLSRQLFCPRCGSTMPRDV